MAKTRKKIRVLIYNKYTMFREGIKALFEEGAPIAIVGEANTASGAIKQLERLRPDVVLMDMTPSDLSGFDATQRIKALDPHVKVLILSLFEDEALLSRCMEAGADGYIRRDERTLHLRAAIHAVCLTGEYQNSRAADGLTANGGSSNGGALTCDQQKVLAREAEFAGRRVGIGK